MAVSRVSKAAALLARARRPKLTRGARIRFTGRVARALLCFMALAVLEEGAHAQGTPEVVTFAGPQGGPFPTGTSPRTLVNPRQRALPWFCVQPVPWLTCTPSQGILPPGGTSLIQFAVDPAVANLLAEGVYAADIVYRDRSSPSGSSTLLRFELTVFGQLDQGWTNLLPSADSRLVFVSSAEGDDANDGLSATAPKRTIAAGKAQLRHGYPDWLLLKRGDTWTESLGQWTTSGRSSTERAVVTGYGCSSERPLLLTGASDGVLGLASGPSPSTLHDVAFVGLHLRAHTYDGQNGAPSGVNWLIESSGLLVEDCEIERYQINVSVPGYGGRKRDVSIRRNVITDAFATSGTVGHGIYLANCDGVTIEENVLDKNGWNASVPGALPSIFRHSIYVQSGSGTCTDVTVRGNVISDSASHGLHLRPGGTCEDNLFLRNPIAISLGGGNEPEPGGVYVSARHNVVLDGRDIDAANRRGWGIDLANIAGGSVTGNIVAHQGSAGFPIAMNLYGDLNGIGVHDTTLAHNVVWDWGGALVVHGTSTQCTALSFTGNALRNSLNDGKLIEHESSTTTGSVTSAQNRFLATAPASAWMLNAQSSCSLSAWKQLVGDTTSSQLVPSSYPDPQRDIARYQASLGATATHAAFIAEARRQSRFTWRPQYTAAAVNDYVRAGFGME